MNHKRIILFLDFDGVLHPRSPVAGNEMFKWLPFLNEALNSFPNLHIVVSSSWRHDPKDLAWALTQFPSALSQRVLGSTPLIGGKNKREQEILAWLSNFGEKPENVVVLDDEPELFTHLRNNVFAVDGLSGFNHKTSLNFVVRLEQKLMHIPLLTKD